MLSRRRATTVIRANWWDGGRLEHMVGPLGPPLQPVSQLTTTHDQARPDGSAALARRHTERGCVLPNLAFSSRAINAQTPWA